MVSIHQILGLWSFQIEWWMYLLSILHLDLWNYQKIISHDLLKNWFDQEIIKFVPFEFKTPDLKGFPCKYPGFPLLSSSCVPFFLSLDQKWSYPKVWVKTKTSLVLLLNFGEKFVTSIKTWTSAIPSCPLWCIWYFNLVKIFSQFYNKDIHI